MRNITLLAIDLAKNVFQLHGTDKKGKAILKMKVTRGKLLEQIANLNPCCIYMEACGSANYWGREFCKYGHKVKLMNPRDIKAYMGRNKNDKNDAAGIARAARDPEAKFCQVKTEQQQDMQGSHRIRSQAVQHRTALANQIRGLLAEYGIIITKGINNIRKVLPEILDRNRDRLSQLMLINFQELYEDLLYLDKKIERCDERIKSFFRKDELCKKLATIPGIGVLNATILSSILGNGSGFRNGRHFAAFVGLTPKQHSSGEKERLLGISKGGDTYLRTLLVHGARAVMLRADKNKDKLSNWVRDLRKRNHSNVVAVALANKIARIAWAVSKFRMDYDPNYVNCIFKKEAKCSGEFTTALLGGAFACP